MTTGNPEQIEADRQTTIRNRENLRRNAGLLYWYEQLYIHQFASISDVSEKRILEIGSGTSPLKRFYPSVITSDLLKLDYLDLIFDCHEIDRLVDIPDASLDVITLTNVLHHLGDPVDFLVKAAVKLKDGGRIIATEPYISLLSRAVYKIHHEPVEFNIDEPKLSGIEGPLATANMAIPFMIFKMREDWAAPLAPYYELPTRLRPYSGLSYMITGGISRRIPIPLILYKPFFALDSMLTKLAPRLLASFFTIELVRLARTN